jgi:hypothetical protein
MGRTGGILVPLHALASRHPIVPFAAVFDSLFASKKLRCVQLAQCQRLLVRWSLASLLSK